ncbi:hypothetical protein SMKI_15G2590 [Saccharomyces mikatae IFO 1815]|uniref:Maf-like protein n=1 Tax=Saccharomyces mikatae IFO 1815 TaxID=226126 RepID=A0AA35IUJ8_SACMI|nr:uncharacterized protein SMKI_15G2590 [Saccharomyces mikatae IFO 1815]CAI4036415.1 hypothetical protein SMKI_15G2590 [Saccharomyces mikatae IFO 1815]
MSCSSQLPSGIIEYICSEYEIILASTSPRRYQILHDTMGVTDLKTMVSTFKEDLDKENYSSDPIGYVHDTSWHKAQSIIEILTDCENQNPNESVRPKLIICADTIIIDRAGKIYEKPKTKEVQMKYLMKFCYEDDEPVSVVTAVTLIKWYSKKNFELIPFRDETKVFFDNKIPLKTLQQYVESGDGLEVGGGFKIQGQGALLIEKIEGDYYNVVGLPLNKTFKALYAEANLP